MTEEDIKLLEAGEKTEETVKFQFDWDTIMDEMTVEEFIGVQRISPAFTRVFLSKHVSDGKGGVLSFRDGYKIVSKMPIGDMIRAAEAFLESFQRSVLNPTKGNGSSPS